MNRKFEKNFPKRESNEIDNGDEYGSGRGYARRKACRFCAERSAKLDYKDQTTLKYFVSERGKIIPRRISGNCALHQRAVARAIKQARCLALIPYIVYTG